MQGLELPPDFDVLPEMHVTKPDKFYRSFQDIPCDYVHSEPDAPVTLSKKELKSLFSRDSVGDKKLHVMLTGPPGSGKSTIAGGLSDELFDTEVNFMGNGYKAFIIDLLQFDGNEILSVQQFLFKHSYTAITDKVAKYLWFLAVTKADDVLFVLHNLDFVPYDYEAECQKIDPYVKSAPLSVIVHNILKGVLFPKCKILSSMRGHRLGKWGKEIQPDVIVQVGEVSEHSQGIVMIKYLGEEVAERVANKWYRDAPALCLLNKTGLHLTYNIMSAGVEKSYKMARTMPWCIVNFILTCIHRLHFPRKPRRIREVILPILHKMKNLAYWGMRQGKCFFTAEEVTEKFGISLEDLDQVLVCHLGGHEDALKLLMPHQNGKFLFMDNHILEFFCALKASEFPIPEYKAFIEECLHESRFCLVRRVLCSVIVDPNVSELVCREKLRIAPTPDDLHFRQELLLKSMSEEYHRVRRYELLEFFYAVHDCGDGGVGILPKEIDEIDLSHIRLYTMDCQAIGAALEHDIKVRHLNLSNCNITPEGMRTLANKIAFSETQIYKLNLDWNPDWQWYYTGEDGLCDIIRYCGVQDLGLCHSKLNRDNLLSLSWSLKEAKIKILRLEHNNTLGDHGYSVIGDFIMKHQVEHLYLTGEDVTLQGKANLLKGLKGYVFGKRSKLTERQKVALAVCGKEVD